MPRHNGHGTQVLPNCEIAVANVPDRKVIRGGYNVDPVRERALWKVQCLTSQGQWEPFQCVRPLGLALLLAPRS